MESGQHHRFELPNGHVIAYEPLPQLSASAYVLRVMDGGKTLSITCSCNGVSKTCAKGENVSCDCTKDPPVLTCD